MAVHFASAELFGSSRLQARAHPTGIKGLFAATGGRAGANGTLSSTAYLTSTVNGRSTGAGLLGQQVLLDGGSTVGGSAVGDAVLGLAFAMPVGGVFTGSTVTGELSGPQAIFPDDVPQVGDDFATGYPPRSDTDLSTWEPPVLLLTNEIRISTFPCVDPPPSRADGTSTATGYIGETPPVLLDGTSSGRSAGTGGFVTAVSLESIGLSGGSGKTAASLLKVKRDLSSSAHGVSDGWGSAPANTSFLPDGSAAGGSEVSGAMIISRDRGSSSGSASVSGTLRLPGLASRADGSGAVSARLRNQFEMRPVTSNGASRVTAMLGKIGTTVVEAVDGSSSVSGDMRRHTLKAQEIQGVGEGTGSLDYQGDIRMRTQVNAGSYAAVRMLLQMTLAPRNVEGVATVRGYERIYPHDFFTEPLEASSSVNAELGRMWYLRGSPGGAAGVLVRARMVSGLRARPQGESDVVVRMRYGFGGDAMGDSQSKGLFLAAAFPVGATIAGTAVAAATLVRATWRGVIQGVATLPRGYPYVIALGVSNEGVLRGASVGGSALTLAEVDVYARGDLTRGVILGAGVASGWVSITRRRAVELWIYMAAERQVTRQMAGWAAYITTPGPPINPPGTDLDDDVDPIQKQRAHFV